MKTTLTDRAKVKAAKTDKRKLAIILAKCDAGTITSEELGRYLLTLPVRNDGCVDIHPKLFPVIIRFLEEMNENDAD